MTKISKKVCWDILEDQLVSISQARLMGHVGEAKLAIAVLISACRDDDRDFLDGSSFKTFCEIACLHPIHTYDLLSTSMEYIGEGNTANFSRFLCGGDV